MHACANAFMHDALHSQRLSYICARTDMNAHGRAHGHAHFHSCNLVSTLHVAREATFLKYSVFYIGVRIQKHPNVSSHVQAV